MVLTRGHTILAIMAVTQVLAMPLAHGQTFTTLHSFKDDPDGVSPTTGLIEHNGTLYGVTQGGGPTPCHCGLVFSMDPITGTETRLHALNGTVEGGQPNALTYANGYLYGTAFDGGTYGFGTLFKVDVASGKLTVLFNFPGATEGSFPNFGVQAFGGALYGTTDGQYYNNGTAVDGTVFKFDLKTETWSLVHIFSTVRDAVMAEGLIQSGGDLFGASLYGGNNLCAGQAGCGIIFKINPATEKETVLHRFRGGRDGAYPSSVIMWQGALYGTLESSGRGCSGSGCGGIFKMDPSTGAKTNLYTFKSRHDLIGPGYGVVYHDGAFYGTADIDYWGGSCGGKGTNCGGIFKFDIKTSSETVLYRFTGGADGGLPEGSLLYYDGALYGTTSEGGMKGCHGNGCGTVFKLTLSR